MAGSLSSSNLLPGTHLPLPPSLKSKNAINSGKPRIFPLSAHAKSTCPSPPASVSSSSTLYGVLGIPSTATCDEIKKAYRNLALVCHPDVVSMDQKDSSAAEFKKIHAAYTTLSDPSKRESYDRDLIFRSIRRLDLPATMVASSTCSGYRCRRNWENDQCW
ncbi:hypothetical protein Nepgr_018211 [Nepenthes gracilis]|uniref:J domain-containing protein n=1 Tax=Nepenthes gracilis TaxID=150966 RepID=A0AAD3SQW0_NEPGR|nr:hypothetical protein Nepgr_018211 [Nepenthes gracilis]